MKQKKLFNKKLCFDLFKQINSVINNCNCQHPSLPIITNNTSPICKNMTSLTCGLMSLKNISNFPTDQDCPQECDTEKFNLNTNSAYYPTRFYSNILMSQSSIQEKFSPPVAFSPENFMGGPSNGAPMQLSQSPTEGSIQSLNEGSTQNSTERSTQNSTKVSTQASTKSSPQIPIKASTQSLTEDVTQSPTEGSTQSSKNNTNNNMQPSQGQLSQSCLKVSIFYSELSYTLIEEIPSNKILDLAGSIGIFDILL